MEKWYIYIYIWCNLIFVWEGVQSGCLIADTTWLLSEKWYTPAVVRLIINTVCLKRPTVWSLVEKCYNLVVWEGLQSWRCFKVVRCSLCLETSVGRLSWADCCCAMLGGVYWSASDPQNEKRAVRGRRLQPAEFGGAVFGMSRTIHTTGVGLVFTLPVGYKSSAQQALCSWMCCSCLCETSSCSVMVGLRSLGVSVFYRRSTQWELSWSDMYFIDVQHNSSCLGVSVF